MTKQFILLFAMTLSLGFVSCSNDGDEEISGGDPKSGIYVINGHKFVDLGLPSGILWAETNIGAASPADPGNYYAWGETAANDSNYICLGDTAIKWLYDWSTYKYGASSSDLTKYNFDDSKTDLDNSDDAAYVNWGSPCRMPTRKDFQELCDTVNCKWTLTNKTTSSFETINGYEFTSKKNGNSIFLPASGYYGWMLRKYGYCGYYWSKTLNGYGDSRAYILSFGMYDFNSSEIDYRYYGNSIRPVAKP